MGALWHPFSFDNFNYQHLQGAIKLIVLSASSTLYHITSSRAASRILQSLTFELKPSDGNDSEERLGKQSYYLSCARSLTSSYVRQSISGSSVIFKFSQSFITKNKTAPVDYWESMKDPMMRDGSIGRNEMEDRVFHKTAQLKIRPSDIEAVYMVYTQDARPIIKGYRYNIYRWCKLNKKPVLFVAHEPNSYKNLINKRWLDIRLTLPKDNDDDGGYRKERERLNLMHRHRKNSILPWLQLYFWPIRDRYAQLKQIGHKADVLQYFDAANVLKADMHNAKGEDFGSPTHERENLTKLVSILRANKQTVNEFVDQLRDKWYKT